MSDACPSDWLSLKQVAARTGVTYQTVLKWVDRGLLPATRMVGREWRVDPAVLDDFVPPTRGVGDGSTLRFARGRDCHSLPTKSRPDDAGWDLYSAEDRTFTVNETYRVRTGTRVGIPKGYVGLVCGRSSVASKGLAVGGGVIDCGYTGEVDVILSNLNDRSKQVRRGEKVAQLLVLKVYAGPSKEVTDLDPTDRGEKGFGSSGV